MPRRALAQFSAVLLVLVAQAACGDVSPGAPTREIAPLSATPTTAAATATPLPSATASATAPPTPTVTPTVALTATASPAAQPHSSHDAGRANTSADCHTRALNSHTCPTLAAQHARSR